MKKLLAVLLATSMTTMVALPPAFAQAFTVSADQQAALGWSADAVSALSAAPNGQAIVDLALQINAAVLAGDSARLLTLMADLTAALEASGLDAGAIETVAVAMANSIEASVSGQAPNSPIRSVANAAITGIAASASAATGGAVDVAQFAGVAAAALQSAPVTQLGATNPTNNAPPAGAAAGGGGGGGGDANGSPTTL